MKSIRLYTCYILFMGFMVGIAGVSAYYMSLNINDYHQQTYNLLEEIDNAE
jgi:hypothetical protein